MLLSFCHLFAIRSEFPAVSINPEEGFRVVSFYVEIFTQMCFMRVRVRVRVGDLRNQQFTQVPPPEEPINNNSGGETSRLLGGGDRVL